MATRPSLRSSGCALAAALHISLVLAGAAAGQLEGPPRLNGFVIDPVDVEATEVLPGGPPRDGIPALDAPSHIAATESSWPDDEQVLGVTRDGVARAYPISILVWHELVNDHLGEHPILVTFCPLCGTGMVFDRKIGDRVRRFGVSGLVFRSDMLLYDRETESLWSQIAARAITGPARGTRLEPMRSRMLSWSRWREEHPQTTVLSPETGHRRNNGTTPYGDYALTKQMLFPVPEDNRYHPKMPTLGLRLPGGAARAYPAAELVAGGGHVEERFDGQLVSVTYDPKTQVFDVKAPEHIEVIEAYWFAWAAFHPQTSVFRAPEARP